MLGKEWNPENLTGNMEKASRIPGTLTLAPQIASFHACLFSKRAPIPRLNMECSWGAWATFLGRLEKIGSLQTPFYLFVLGLCLEAKAIKQKTIGDAKKWKTSHRGPGLIFQLTGDGGSHGKTQQCYRHSFIHKQIFIELLSCIRHILGLKESGD